MCSAVVAGSVGLWVHSVCVWHCMYVCVYIPSVGLCRSVCVYVCTVRPV